MIPLIVKLITIKSSRSTSKSFESTFPAKGVSASVVKTSSTATGISFTGVTIIVKLALSVASSLSATI